MKCTISLQKRLVVHMLSQHLTPPKAEMGDIRYSCISSSSGKWGYAGSPACGVPKRDRMPGMMCESPPPDNVES